MRPHELLITRDPRLVELLQTICHGRLALLPRWPSRKEMPQKLAIVDAAALYPSEWIHVERWSRQPERPTLILVDDGQVPRERLVRVLAEALVPFGATYPEMLQRIEPHLWDHPFRVAEHTIRRAIMPHPLGKFLASAFTAKCRKVSTLARSLGMSESTLRNQWVRWRSDSGLRLEDILKRIDDSRQPGEIGEYAKVVGTINSLVVAITGPNSVHQGDIDAVD